MICIRRFAALLLVFVLVGCANTGTRHVKEGFVNITGGRVWYRMVGGDNRFARTPLLVVHGGPGLPHDYLAPLEELADERPVVFYDQLGCGKSDRPTDDSLWTIARSVQEIQQVRDELKLKEVMIYAHSLWGSALVTDYLLQQPDGVRAVVFASPSFSVPRYERDVQKLIGQLPVQTQQVIRRHERDGTTDDPEYRAAVEFFNHRHICRTEPWPKEVLDAQKGFGLNVWEALHGRSAFAITGRLRGYDRTPALERIGLPVLLTCGRYDVTTPEALLAYAALFPNAKMIVYVKSGHNAQLDEQEQYLADLRKFITQTDPRREKEFFETQ